MTTTWRNLLALLLFIAAAPVFSQAASTGSGQAASAGSGQAYPTKPVRVLVPFSAGSAADILARILAPKLYEAWGHQFVVDNRPSAGGIVAGSIVATAVPDGYTLMLTSSAFAGSAALYPQMPYDSIRDFSAVMPIVSTPLFVVVAPSLGVNTLKELLALARQKPKQLNFASAGIGSGTHYATELFNHVAGISAVHVPYKGVPEGLNDTLSGRIHYFIAPVLPSLSLIRGGRVLALAATTPQRVPMLPEVPTAAEAGLSGYEYVGWFGILAPAKTPRAIIAKLHVEVSRVLESAEIRDKIASQGASVMRGTPEALEKLIREEIVTRRKIFTAAGIKPD